MPPLRVVHYLTPEGADVFADWFDRLRDAQGKARIAVRLDRLALGLAGDARALREGVHELRIDSGPGYRVYFAYAGRAVVLLLCGGDKGTQSRDIRRAIGYWQDYQEQQR